jgi:ATP-dependent Zn protease
MKSKTMIAAVCVVLLCVAWIIWLATGSERGPAKLTYSQFLERVRAGEVASIVIRASNSGAMAAICSLKDGATVRTVLPANYKDAMEAMQERSVSIEVQDPSSEPGRIIANASPFLALLVIWFFVMLRFRNDPKWRLFG